MPIPIQCTCGFRGSARDDSAGKSLKCPSCGTRIQVPAPVGAAKTPGPYMNYPTSKRPPAAGKEAKVELSPGIKILIALAYHEVTHAYGVDALEIPVSQLLILMGSSMVGSMLQLPAVGGGSQMATIATLSSVFDVPPELAASCGILLWLVTFAAVIPLGLMLAHREGLSLRKLSAESHRTQEQPPPA